MRGLSITCCRAVTFLAVALARQSALAADGGIQFHGAAGAGFPLPGTSQGQLSIALPPGFTPGDLLVTGIALSGTDGNPQLVLDGGWTLLDQTVDNSTQYGAGAWWLYRVTGPNEPPSYAFTLSGLNVYYGDGAYGVTLAYGGVDPARPVRSHVGMDALGAPWASSSASANSGDWLVFSVGVVTNLGPDTWTTPASLTYRFGQAPLAFFDQGPEPGGTVAPFSVSSAGTSAGGNNGAVETLVLIPAPPATTDGGGAGSPDGGMAVGCSCNARGDDTTPWLGAAMLLTALLAVRRRGS